MSFVFGTDNIHFNDKTVLPLIKTALVSKLVPCAWLLSGKL